MTRTTRMTAADWLVVAEAAVLLPWAAGAVRMLSLRRAAWLIAGCPAVGLRARVTPARVAQLVGAVGARLRCRCLPQALVTSRFLARQGVRGDVIIGTVRVAGTLRAHAWVRVNGQPLDAGDVSSYDPIYMLSDHRSPRKQAA